MDNWIVCLGGEDWWYHSHAHFDIQVMKRLSRRCPVLYVCSIGMRMPSLRNDTLFWVRIKRKLRSVSRLLRRVHSSLYVYSPLPFPLYQHAWGRAVNRGIIAAQLSAVFASLRIHNPLFWINTPTAWPIVRRLNRRGAVYQRTDDYTAYTFDNFNAEYVREVDLSLMQQADVILHVSDDLHEAATRVTDNAVLLPQGVDERFFATDVCSRVPSDVDRLNRPIIGYVGGMDQHKFLTALVHEVAAALPEYSFVFVGPPHPNAESLRQCENVHFLGARSHEDIPAYVRSFDVCILPTPREDWGMKCRPIKLMEYLADGKPPIATSTPAASAFADAICISNDPTAWVRELRQMGANGKHMEPDVVSRMREYSWERQVDRIWDILKNRRLVEHHRSGADETTSVCGAASSDLQPLFTDRT